MCCRDILIQRGAEEVGASVAHFCREAAIASGVLWEARTGSKWTDPEVWDDIMTAVHAIDEHDIEHRATVAREARWAAPGNADRAEHHSVQASV